MVPLFEMPVPSWNDNVLVVFTYLDKYVVYFAGPAQPVVPPGHRIVYTPDGPVFKNDNNEVLYNTPPPPYEATTQAEQYGKPSNDPDTMHVDSTSTVNLVNNEVRQA